MKVLDLIVKLQKCPPGFDVEHWCPDGYDDVVDGVILDAKNGTVRLAGMLFDRHKDKDHIKLHIVD